LEEHVLVFIKDIVSILAYSVTFLGGVYAFFKWVWPKLSPYFMDYMYVNFTGVHVIRDIETHFGKNAGRVLKEIIQRRGLDIAIDEMRLNIIENTIGLGIYICHSDGKCTYANKTLAKMFGISQEDMLGYGWLAPIVDKQKAYQIWKFALDNNIPYRDKYEVTVDGEIKLYYSEAEASVSENDGIILGYVGIVRLIDDKKDL